MKKKWVYLFSELEEAEATVEDWEGVRGLLGGKGANLAEMARIGVPVPPGFTVTTEACIAYLAAGGSFPPDIWKQELDALKCIEEATGKRFGDPERPLLVSCRSGAKFSMPGMMDTILNLGMNDEVAEGMVKLTGDARFVYDSYRRLVQMFGTVVRGMEDDVFEEVIEQRREERGVLTDPELSADDWIAITQRFKELVKIHTRAPFPSDPLEQLKAATEAVFESWNTKRAMDYRNASGIPHDLGTAVNIVTMVFGNMGETSGTGVVMSRNPSTGEPGLHGDFLPNAQGEDVVAGTRQTFEISAMAERFPEAYAELCEIADTLERHYRNMQDLEFTIENGKLWLLQTRNGKRTAQAEVRIAVDMVDEGLLRREEAVLRVSPDQVDFYLHPQFDEQARSNAQLIAKGLNVSPGAAVGVIAFDADTAEKWAREEGKSVIMVRPETKPDDVHGMLAAEGIVTSRGGRTSHAALVARQFGKPAVVGVEALEIDLADREARVGDLTIREGTEISIDGARGEVYLGALPKVTPNIDDPWLSRLMEWADEFRTLQVWANADYPDDARRARSLGAQGIGLCRTEHMFFEEDRLPIMREMIMARTHAERESALDKLLPLQRGDFEGLFQAMDGLPVVVRLLDPPLHEFLPNHQELLRELAELKLKLQHLDTLREIDATLDEIRAKQDFLARTEELLESNPMLGTRGVRLAMLMPELTRMQTRALFQAAASCMRNGVDVQVEVMIPLVSHVNELKTQRAIVEAEARQVMDEEEREIPYKLGTMIEIPRAALMADVIASEAEFFSFGTNDLTQTVYGISRDDAEKGFLIQYLEQGVLPDNPFATLDQDGVGRIMRQAVELGRSTRPTLEIGICGEHGGDPRSVEFCHTIGLNYVSCSPFRVPVARFAAAQAAVRSAGWKPMPAAPRDPNGRARAAVEPAKAAKA
ncbi:MAG TPA: pyruvate, phosphate dikinase [Longimicrobiales bacterium]|nr:pyruvate, phosphate dikinase [Longimicrobiales bacterium]